VELQQAIVKIEQGGSADGILQVNFISGIKMGSSGEPVLCCY